ncbi:MAG: hypothetical protein ACW96U_00110 [Candidatus Heimdallarchaeaceae archaeon]
MITLVNGKPEDKIPAVANEAMVQGQFCVIASYDGDDAVMALADDTDEDQLDTNKLYLVFSEAYRMEGTEEDDWDDIAADDRVIRVPISSGLIVEDSTLSANNTAAVWASASVGDAMILNTDAILTLDGASDDPGTGATIIAKFIRIQNGIIYYEMDADNIDTA